MIRPPTKRTFWLGTILYVAMILAYLALNPKIFIEGPAYIILNPTNLSNLLLAGLIIVGVIPLLIHPRVGLEVKRIYIRRDPDIVGKPLLDELKQQGAIHAEVKVVNRSGWDFILPTTRAEDCRAEVLFFQKGKKRSESYVYRETCYWHGERPTVDIPASFYPTVLRLFSVDPYSHGIVHTDQDTMRRGIGVIPPGNYDVGLVLDAKGASATDIALGAYDFPTDFVSDNQYRDDWKAILKDGGYAVFFERDIEGRNFANVVGKMPDERKAQLRQELRKEIALREV